MPTATEELNNAIVALDGAARGTIAERAAGELSSHWQNWFAHDRPLLHQDWNKLNRYARWYMRAYPLVPAARRGNLVHPKDLMKGTDLARTIEENWAQISDNYRYALAQGQHAPQLAEDLAMDIASTAKAAIGWLIPLAVAGLVLMYFGGKNGTR